MGRYREIQWYTGRYREMQIKHPGDARSRRMQAGNANFKRLLALPGARALLCALGFVEREGGATWRWLTLTLNPNPKP